MNPQEFDGTDMDASAERLIEDVKRQFKSGATRSPDYDRYDPEGYLSPIAIERFCEYMRAHQVESDGNLRASDNWQRGLPVASYMKALWRHLLHLWTRYRGFTVTDGNATRDKCEDLCAIIFNAQGMLHEYLKRDRRPSEEVK